MLYIKFLELKEALFALQSLAWAMKIFTSDCCLINVLLSHASTNLVALKKSAMMVPKKYNCGV